MDRFYWDEEEPKKSRRERRREREELEKREREEPGKSRRERRLEREKKKRKAGVAELVLTAAVAFVLVFGFVRPYVVEAYRIPTESMVPTLEVGDRVLANKFVYRFTEPKRRDIVVFDSVDEDDYQTLIKRVVGIAGDEIQVQGGVLYVNGEAQEEPYLNDTDLSRGPYGPTVVPEGHIFVMGDNRGNSADSRVFGPLPLENLKGEAFMRFWPVSKISTV
ncbi:MAG: signal peptidase I [Actinobacteria bacterium]|nr:signal peptidase I [Actinomycetota bacterium]